jgi:hypothetical protein
VVEAAINKKRLPLPPAQERRSLPNPFWIAALTKEPPAICHAKGKLQTGGGVKALVYKKHATRAEQLLAIVQRVAHERRSMQHVGGDDCVALMRREALEARVGVDVEQ